jgi:hypothetical protein
MAGSRRRVQTGRASIRGGSCQCQSEVGGRDAAEDLRQYDAAILSSPTGVLPCLSSQLEVYCATNAVVDDGLGVDPGVDDQAGAGLEAVRLALAVGGIKVVEQRCGGDLRGRMARTRSLCRRGRVDGHARVVDETHGRGLRGIAPSVTGVGVDAREQKRVCVERSSECRGKCPSPRVREAWVRLMGGRVQRRNGCHRVGRDSSEGTIKRLYRSKENARDGEARQTKKEEQWCLLASGRRSIPEADGVRALEPPLRLGCIKHK